MGATRESYKKKKEEIFLKAMFGSITTIKICYLISDSEKVARPKCIFFGLRTGRTHLWNVFIVSFDFASSTMEILSFSF